MPLVLKQKSVEEMKKGLFAPKEEKKEETKETSYKKGGKVKTAQQNPKHKNCW
jgi:hypothetical protein